jgi:hypothetical protein
MAERLDLPSFEPGADSTIEGQINFVLSHPGMTSWLKDTLRSAFDQDPIQILNELEILNLILRKRAEVMIENAFGPYSHSDR